MSNVNQAFDEDGNCIDSTVENQIKELASSLIEYLRLNVCPRMTLEELARQDQ